MTPAARISAAIEVLDAVLSGDNAERVLTAWARSNRYAGSKDRAAIRDLVFQALRCRRSYAWLGGAETGRGLMLGHLRDIGADAAEVFTGERFAPDALSEAEQALASDPMPCAVQLDVPDWLLPKFESTLGEDADAVLRLMRDRASVFLRVNLQKASVDQAVAALAAEGVTATPHPLSPTALEVQGAARGLQSGAAFADGLIELQDAASQAVADMLPVAGGARVLDYCAGGGGKTLALAGRVNAEFTAHDANPARLKDLPDRAARAGVKVRLADGAALNGKTYDLVLADVPCSGSGSWRRAPQAKWDLTPERLRELTDIQAGILDDIAPMVASGGTLAYVTCSLFSDENDAQVAAFCQRHAGWSVRKSQAFSPLQGGDGFYVALLAWD